MENRRNMVKVVVVGAGAAGIAAATKLHQNGFDVMILEAENRIGGRLHCHQTDSGFVELGAQWIHGEQHWLYDYARDNGLLAPSVHLNRETGALFEDARKISGVEHAELMTMAQGFSDFFCPDVLVDVASNVSVGEKLSQLLHDGHAQWIDAPPNRTHQALRASACDWVNRCLKTDSGADSLHDVSVQNYRDEICIGNYNHQLKAAYISILERILSPPGDPHRIAFPSEKILLQTTVRSISFNAEKNYVEVRIEETGEVIVADHVVVTVSLGVLKTLHRQLFSPALSERKQQAIDHLGYGMIGKVVLIYDKPFWSNWKFDYVDGETRALALFWEENLEEEAKCDPEKRYANQPWYRAIRSITISQSLPNTLVCFLAGKQVKTMEVLPEAEIVADVTGLLSRFSGETTVPFPTKIIRSDWASNPHFLGTYSYISIDGGRQGLVPIDLSEPEWLDHHSAAVATDIISGSGGAPKTVPRLLFAGEATHPQYFSMVHGAILSGWREADRLILLY